jgi:hypothetical protein
MGYTQNIRNAYDPWEIYRAGIISLLQNYKRRIGAEDLDDNLAIAHETVDELLMKMEFVVEETNTESDSSAAPDWLKAKWQGGHTVGKVD